MNGTNKPDGNIHKCTDYTHALMHPQTHNLSNIKRTAQVTREKKDDINILKTFHLFKINSRFNFAFNLFLFIKRIFFLREIFISGNLPFHCHKVRYIIMDIPFFYNFPGYHTNTHTHVWYLMGEEAWGKFVKNKQLINSRRCATTTHKLYLFLYHDILNKKIKQNVSKPGGAQSPGE